MDAEHLLLENVEVDGVVTSCLISGTRIRALGESARTEGVAHDRIRVINGAGGALLPGLADHHLHLLAAAARMTSVDLSGVDRALWGQVLLAESAARPHGWLRVVGADDDLERSGLDLLVPDRPVRVQHRSGALWTLNSAGVDVFDHGLSPVERRTGKIWRSDSRVRDLLSHGRDDDWPDVARVGRYLASKGVTHVTDATPNERPQVIERLRDEIPQHLLHLGSRDGSGPVKIVIADHRDHDYEDLRAAIGAARGAGRPVAIHAVSRTALAMTIAALNEFGPVSGDRVEHCSVAGHGAVAALARLDVAVVTNPAIYRRAHSRLRRESPPEDLPDLWRLRSLLDAGVPLALGSDAPYGDLNPWDTLRAAILRPPLVHDDVESLAPEVAFRSLMDDPREPGRRRREVRPGHSADLCLLAVPVAQMMSELPTSEPTVVATIISGTVAFDGGAGDPVGGERP